MTSIPLPELDAFFAPGRPRVAVEVFPVRRKGTPTRWGFQLSNGKGCGLGYTSKTKAQEAGDTIAAKWN